MPDNEPEHDASEPQSRKTRREELRERDEKAVQLRIAGYGYAQIAKQIGYSSPSTAWRAVERVRTATLRESGQELLALELDRLDTLQRANMTKALRGDAKATNTILRLMEQRAKLTGLYDARSDALVADAREAFAVFLGTVRTVYPEPEPVAPVEQGAA